MLRNWILELTYAYLVDYLSAIGFILYGGGKSDAPDTPDYAAAATAQGVANQAAARSTAKLNNPNIINPMGTQTVVYGGEPTFDAAGYDAAMQKYQADLQAYNNKSASKSPSTYSNSLGSWYSSPTNASSVGQKPKAPDKNAFWMGSGDPDVGTVTQTLSPGEQLVYDKGLQSRQNLGDLSIQGSEALKGIVGTQLDLSGAPAVGSGSEERQKVYDALMGRINEDTANSRDQANADLIARGIPPGTKAYDDAMNLITRGYNDARSQSEVSAGNAASQAQGMDLAARNSYISNLLTQRQTPLNEITALMSNSQVSNPFAGNLGYQAGANMQPAPVMQGAMNQGAADISAYNANTANSNSTLGGLFSLGAAAFSNPSFNFSDLRLKSNIVKIGQHPRGFGIYEYDIFGNREIGVMAQEVEKVIPEAVITHRNGYKMVNYRMLNHG